MFEMAKKKAQAVVRSSNHTSKCKGTVSVVAGEPGDKCETELRAFNNEYGNGEHDYMGMGNGEHDYMGMGYMEQGYDQEEIEDYNGSTEVIQYHGKGGKGSHRKAALVCRRKI